MKRYHRNIIAADETTAEDRLKESIDQVKDNFEYAIEGIYQLADRLQMDDANAILEALNTAVEEAITSVSEAIIE